MGHLIINRLTLTNFGIYQGENTFNMSADKPVVLIGGLNGCGKTTFLEAVLLALYGSSSPAYTESDYTTFGNYLRAHSNSMRPNEKSSVELSFTMKAGGTNTAYTVKRTWNPAKTRIAPQTEVYRNGFLDSNLTENWAMYVEDILPHSLSGFFFFDGEKIAELVDRNDESAQMKHSIKALLGIDLVDSLQSDLKRLNSKVAKRSRSSRDQEELERLQKKCDELANALQEIDLQVEQAQARIDKLNKEKEAQISAYAAAGGVALDSIEQMREKQLLLSNEASDIESDMVALSATAFPLMLVRDMLSRALGGAREEFDFAVFEKAFNQIEELLGDYSAQNPSVNMDGLAKYLKDSLSAKKREAIYEPTSLLLGQMEYLESEHFDYLMDNYRKLSSEKADRERKLAAVEDFLGVDIDSELVSEISSKIHDIESDIDDLEVEIRIQQSNRPKINGELIHAQAAYKKSLVDYLESQNRYEDDSRTIIYLAKVNRVLESYKVKLQQRKVRELGDSITECFRKLARKTDLITRVYIDPSSLDFTYFGSNGNPVPQEILSSGERQLVVISTLWALSLNSKEKLPVIIDTPLARLDTKHRMALVNVYFPQASDQAIILSTDSEVTGECYERLRPNISEEYTLVYDEAHKSTAIVPGYFDQE